MNKTATAFVDPYPINDLPETSTFIPGEILIAGKDGNDYKMDTDVLKKTIASGIKGDATPTSSPTPWASGQPDLYEKWDIKTAGTYTNFKDSSNASIIVSTADLQANFVQIWVKNGVSSKYLSVKPVADLKIDTWAAGPYTVGKQVINPADQSVYEANADVIASDVPGVSTKWVKKIGSYKKNNISIELFTEKLGSIISVAKEGANSTYSLDSTGLQITSVGLGNGITIEKPTNLGSRFVEFKVKLGNDTKFYLGTKASESPIVGQSHVVVDCSSGKMDIFQYDSTTNIVSTKNLSFPIVSGREYIVRFYKVDQITTSRLEIIDTITGNADYVETKELQNQFDKYKFGVISSTSNVVLTGVSINALIEDRPYMVFYGDSITEANIVGSYTNLPFHKDRFANLIGEYIGKPYLVSGRSGGTIDGVIARMKTELPKLLPNYVFVTIGTNGGNTIEKLNLIVDYCENLGIKVILNLIPLYDGTTAAKNTMIQEVVNARSLLSVKMNIATSVNGDGITKDNSLFVNENSVYIHPNIQGNKKIYIKALADIKDVFKINISADNENGNNEKITSTLKYFLEQPTGVETLDTTYILKTSGNSLMYGISLQANRILQQNNTLATYSDANLSVVVFQNILLLQGAKRITRIVLDIIPYGNGTSGTNANLVGIRNDNTVVPLVKHPTTPAPTTLQHYEIDVSDYKSISVGLQISTNNPPSIPESLNQVIKFYTKSADGDVDGVKKYVDSQIKLHTPYLDLIDFGCVGNGITDDTAKFNEAIIALINNGGGTIFGRANKFLVSSLTIPDVPSWLKVEIAGAGMPVNRFGTIGNFDISSPVGTMQIVSNLNNNSKGVINVNPGSFSGWNLVFLSLKNLAIRTYNNPNCWGVNAHVANQLNMENVAIDTGVYNVQASDPTNGSIGILTPRNSNGAFNQLRNISVSGMAYGIQVQEHTDGDQIILSSCKHGLYFRFGSHASRFGRVNSQRNTNHITIASDAMVGQNYVHKFDIQQLNMEYTGNGQTDTNNAWQSTIYELNDPNNGAIADIKYTNVKGALGGVETFRFNGGSRVNVKQIGSDTRLTSTIPSP